jgi:hypothetical protein
MTNKEEQQQEEPIAVISWSSTPFKKTVMPVRCLPEIRRARRPSGSGYDYYNVNNTRKGNSNGSWETPRCIDIISPRPKHGENRRRKQQQSP